MPSDALPKTEEAFNPEPYSISEQEFKTPPTEITDYMVGDKVTRNNFINFFMYSFAVSRGVPNSQIIFIRWVDVIWGFDSEKTFKNLKKVGGWNSLSLQEKEIFMSAFRKIPLHNERYKERVSTYIVDEFNKMLDYLSGSIVSGAGVFNEQTKIKLKRIENIKELMKYK